MNKKRFNLILLTIVSIFFGLSINTNKVSAAKYGARLYTTPKAMRGTWYLKNTKTMPNTGVKSDVLHPYSKIKIGTHTIIFTKKRGKRGLSGKYTLYKTPKNVVKFSIKKINAAEKYASKHKWLAPDNINSRGFEFRKETWLRSYSSTSNGALSVKGRTLILENIFMKDTFRK